MLTRVVSGSLGIRGPSGSHGAREAAVSSSGLPTDTTDKFEALRGPLEDYSDVVLWLAAKGKL
jgi:hypothetical protein